MPSGHHDQHHVKVDGAVNVLYLCMKGYGEGNYESEWWALKRDENDDGVSPIGFYREDELGKQQQRNGNGDMIIDDYFSCVVLGEEIYMIGGCEYDLDPDLTRPSPQYGVESFSKAVRIYHRGTREWRNGEPMLVPRCMPDVAILQGKIYVFGGAWYYYDSHHIRHPGEPWAEYYDPMSRKWYPVPNLPSTISELDSEHAILLSEDQILLSHDSYKYRFDATEERWETMSGYHHTGHYEHYVQFNHNLANATDGDVLYWYYGDSLFAYDLLRNDKSSSSDIGGPIFTFENIWDGPEFVYSDGQLPWLVIDDISNEGKNKKKKMACLIWYDSIARAIIYTNFELLLLVEEYGIRRIEAKWNGRYQRLNFNPRDATRRYHIEHCLQMVSSSSRDKDIQVTASQNSSSFFSRNRQGLALQNLYDGCIEQQALARLTERYRMEKELSKKVTARVKAREEEDNGNDNESLDQALKGFMDEHEIQELKDLNIDLDTFKINGRGPWCSYFRFNNLWHWEGPEGRGLRIPRAQRIKLAIAFGWTSEFMEVYRIIHTYGSPCHSCSERSVDIDPEPYFGPDTNQDFEATSNSDPNQLWVPYDSDSDGRSNAHDSDQVEDLSFDGSV